ncbi:hypothetical protein P280DRAFT_523087 [Massarina eburnea CBS 473.64]|uniref:Uncharacterized protein n=1 Tax=Massarina eburnea CBS 473.64 TaxID=1395130 RepID=A0A6A6RJN8_9PLEO|nr:hypothetical protein P280DRAFT_523087 [Massarina eburnea CBS 473.64]
MGTPNGQDLFQSYLEQFGQTAEDFQQYMREHGLYVPSLPQAQHDEQDVDLDRESFDMLNNTTRRIGQPVPPPSLPAHNPSPESGTNAPPSQHEYQYDAHGQTELAGTENQFLPHGNAPLTSANLPQHGNGNDVQKHAAAYWQTLNAVPNNNGKRKQLFETDHGDPKHARDERYEAPAQGHSYAEAPSYLYQDAADNSFPVGSGLAAGAGHNEDVSQYNTNSGPWGEFNPYDWNSEYYNLDRFDPDESELDSYFPDANTTGEPAVGSGIHVEQDGPVGNSRQTDGAALGAGYDWMHPIDLSGPSDNIGDTPSFSTEQDLGGLGFPEDFGFSQPNYDFGPSANIFKQFPDILDQSGDPHLANVDFGFGLQAPENAGHAVSAADREESTSGITDEQTSDGDSINDDSLFGGEDDCVEGQDAEEATAGKDTSDVDSIDADSLFGDDVYTAVPAGEKTSDVESIDNDSLFGGGDDLVGEQGVQEMATDKAMNDTDSAENDSLFGGNDEPGEIQDVQQTPAETSPVLDVSGFEVAAQSEPSSSYLPPRTSVTQEPTRDTGIRPSRQAFQYAHSGVNVSTNPPPENAAAVRPQISARQAQLPTGHSSQQIPALPTSSQPPPQSARAKGKRKADTPAEDEPARTKKPRVEKTRREGPGPRKPYKAIEDQFPSTPEVRQWRREMSSHKLGQQAHYEAEMARLDALIESDSTLPSKAKELRKERKSFADKARERRTARRKFAAHEEQDRTALISQWEAEGVNVLDVSTLSAKFVEYGFDVGLGLEIMTRLNDGKV